MGRGAGESSLTPRLFLVAPERPANEVLASLRAACAAGDVASLVIPPGLAAAVTAAAQAMDVAVLLADDPAQAVKAGCDGVHLDAASQSVAEARKSLGKDRIVGAFVGASRHLAMEAAEAGADYVAFAQNGPSIGGVPLVAWWADLAEIPCVAFDPVTAAELDILLPQTPDFIRPSDAMWQSPEEARRIITALNQHLAT